MKTYLLVQDGKPTGPFSIEELKKISVKPGSFLKSPEMDDYREAHEIPELRMLFGFKAPLFEPQYFATLDIRLLAIAIDYFVIFGLYCLFALVLISFVNQQSLRIGIALGGLIFIPILRSMYAVFAEASAKQATIGKQLLGIKVCDEQGRKLDLSQSFLRNASKWLSTLTLGVGYLSGFFSRKQQCLHDVLVGTLVVKERLL